MRRLELGFLAICVLLSPLLLTPSQAGLCDAYIGSHRGYVESIPGEGGASDDDEVARLRTALADSNQTVDKLLALKANYEKQISILSDRNTQLMAQLAAATKHP